MTPLRPIFRRYTDEQTNTARQTDGHHRCVMLMWWGLNEMMLWTYKLKPGQYVHWGRGEYRFGPSLRKTLSFVYSFIHFVQSSTHSAALCGSHKSHH